jgi:P27 family predicted phage terminase small subunit
MGKRDPLLSGPLVKSTDGNARRNPLLKVSADAANAMLRFAGEFGLTPVARSRIGAGVHGQPPGGGKFDGFLGGA